MSFLDILPKAIEDQEKVITDLWHKKRDINWGHECDCEYCDREGDDADPEAEEKDQAIEREIKEAETELRRMKRYANWQKVGNYALD